MIVINKKGLPVIKGKKFVCAGQLIVKMPIQLIKLPCMVVTRLLFWFGLFALSKGLSIPVLEKVIRKKYKIYQVTLIQWFHR